jgi:hypothetical protein
MAPHPTTTPVEDIPELCDCGYEMPAYQVEHRHYVGCDVCGAEYEIDPT